MVEEPPSGAVAQENGDNIQTPADDDAQPSMVVGKIPPGEGLWGALEAITTCDPVRNGALVVFSHEASGRLGVFCNRYITGALIDSSDLIGLKALKKLLAVSSGMFCFRPCFPDEIDELGQSISLDINEVLQACVEVSSAKPPSEAVQALTGTKTKGALADNYLGDVADKPLESALIVTTESTTDGLPIMPSPDSLFANAEDFSTTNLLGKNAPSQADYLDWFDEQEKNEGGSLNLRKILLPVMQQQEPTENVNVQLERDLASYRNVLRNEEEKLRRDIERTMDKAVDGLAKQKLDDMKLLAGMLHAQEEMIEKRWQGLDDIPTPRVNEMHVDHTGQMRLGAPVRSKKEFLAGCEDLVNQSTKPTDPREFIKKGAESEERRRHFWLNHPQMLALACLGVLVLIVAGISSQLNSSDVKRLLKEGREDVADERWADAVLALNAALEKDPNSGEAYFYRGIALAEHGDDKKAEADFQSARAHGVPEVEVAIAQAGIDIRREEWQKVLDVCDHAILHGANNIAIYRERANANLHLGDYKQAIHDCEKALSLCKDDKALRAQILADRGYARIQHNDFAGGAKDFDEALAAHPDVALYTLKGDAYRKVKRFSNAINSYTRALDLDPHNYNAYVARGICYVATGKKQDAMKDFGRALEITPNGVEALIQRGSLHLDGGAYLLALQDLQMAWDLNPTIDETRKKLMLAYEKSKQAMPKSLAVAYTASQSAPLKMPSDPAQIVLLGYKALNQGDANEAIEYLVAALKKQPNNADARRYLAHAYASLGDSSAAAAQFAVLSSLQALSTTDAITYADALEKGGDLKGASVVLNRAVATDPNDVKVHVKLARLYYQSGQKKEGDQIAQQGLAHATSDSDKHELTELMRGGTSSGTAIKPNVVIPGSHG